MTTELNRTHSPQARSWVKSANRPDTDFPIQNLPFGVFEFVGTPRLCVAIGDQLLDLQAVLDAGLLDSLPKTVLDSLHSPSWNALMALGRNAASLVRGAVFDLLVDGSVHQQSTAKSLSPQDAAKMLLPAQIGDYTDFYASLYHATNVGSMFRPDNPLLPNYKWIPIGYHGRASSIVPSGTKVPRPHGQTKTDKADAPESGPTQRLDYELEIGVLIGTGNSIGSTISLAKAENHAFGLCLVNDWSARDMQAWEYQPLGPFLAKNFLTTISPWIVTMEALAPFRIPAFVRDAADPQPLPYLLDAANAQAGGFNITLEVSLASRQMRELDMPAEKLTTGNFRDMYWTLAQMITHHASNGCNLRPGDLLASGTVSGKQKESRGCLLELTWKGTDPITLPTGETRRFLQDGDEVTFRGYCQREGAASIGFGECTGIIVG